MRGSEQDRDERLAAARARREAAAEAALEADADRVEDTRRGCAHRFAAQFPHGCLFQPTRALQPDEPPCCKGPTIIGPESRVKEPRGNNLTDSVEIM